MQQKLSKTPAKNQQKPSKNTAKRTVFRCVYDFLRMLGLANAWCKKLEEEEMKEEKERRKRRKRKRRRRKRTKKRRGWRGWRGGQRGRRGRSEEERGGEGGGSLSKISSEETLSKLRLKLNQNKAKSTKHAGRPADLLYIGAGILYHLMAKPYTKPHYTGNRIQKDCCITMVCLVNRWEKHGKITYRTKNTGRNRLNRHALFF